MKNLVLVVLLVVVAIAGYDFMNKTADETDVPVVEVTETEVIEEVVTATDDAVAEEIVMGEEAVTEESISMITPADMSEEAQSEMYDSIMEYNKCMMQNRLEYHQQGNNAEQVANKTMAACENHLDTLAATLLANNVNEDLRKGMVMTMRKRAARKLMSAVTQSLAGQAAAAANAVVPAPVTP